LLSIHQLMCWGDNGSGQLGNAAGGRIGDDELLSIYDIADLGGEVVELAASGSVTCAIRRKDGARELLCWGANAHGQLGHGHVSTIGDDEAAVTTGPIDVGGEVLSVSTSGSHTCALRDDFNVLCWGKNESGELGYGHVQPIGDDELPSSAGEVSVGGEVRSVIAGSAHTCVIRQDDEVVCWGANSSGELGYGHTETIGDDELPDISGPVQFR
jgi:alpha-tubulin suppressor-like RCC1 family protein